MSGLCFVFIAVAEQTVSSITSSNGWWFTSQ